jgi:hypothetical protein
VSGVPHAALDTPPVLIDSSGRREIRRFGPVALARSHAALVVLRTVCVASGRWASGSDLHDAWRGVHGCAVPPDVTGRWTRAFEPGIASGEVQAQQMGRMKAYAPTASAETLLPAADSALVHVERALLAAYTRCGGAVPVEEVERELASMRPEVEASSTPTWSRLGRLAQERRIHIVTPVASRTRSRRYYAPLGVPARVAWAAELSLEKRVRAIHGIWRASEGRPFTTRAVATFAQSRPELYIADDPTYGWTNALQHLCTSGLLCRAHRSDGSRAVRWALASEWTALADAERATRVLDPFGRHQHPRATAGDEPTATTPAGVDTSDSLRLPASDAYRVRADCAKISRNQDMVALVRHAIERRASRGDAADYDALRQQPVSLREIERLRASFPRLMPASISLITALHEATRVRHGARKAALVHMGTIRNTTLFAAERTRAGDAFVEWYRMVCDENHVRLARVVAELEEDAASRFSGSGHVPSRILSARARQIEFELLTVQTRLVRSEGLACLTAAQLLRSQTVCRVVRERIARVQVVLRGAGGGSGVLVIGDERILDANRDAASEPPYSVIDIALAAQQIESAVTYSMGSPRELWSRIVHGVRLLVCLPESALSNAPQLTAGAQRQRPKSGRQVANAFERVSFALWAARRFGSPLYGGLSEQARRCIGELRDTAAIVDALLDPRERGSHTELCAALGFIDDVDARDGLVVYLTRACEDAVAARGTTAGATANTGSRTNSAAISTAAFGLARLPFGGVATVLRPSEREILAAVRESYPTLLTRAYASLVIEGWDAKWTPEEWMRV